MTVKYDLSGEWLFSFEKPLLDDILYLPGTTAQAKKGELNKKSETGYLTEKYPFSGKIYVERRVQLRQKEVGCPVFLRLERTRVTKVWVDEVLVGTQDSLTCAHVYELTDYIHRKEFNLRIEVANDNYPTPGGHLTSPDTQTNWIGILGEISLTVYDKISIRDVKASYQQEDEEQHSVLLKIKLDNQQDRCWNKLLVTAYQKQIIEVEKEQDIEKSGHEQRNIELEQRSEHMKIKHNRGGEIKSYPIKEKQCESKYFIVKIPQGESTLELQYIFDAEPILWSEYTPVLYRFELLLMDAHGNVTEASQVETGLRKFEARGHYFYINENRTMLRGKHDGMIFPLTGAAPMEVEEWIKVMQTAKEYGINHYRFHTCCPPRAAFAAADLLGIYMEPELPFWGTITEEGEEGHNQAQQEYLIEEGFRILKEFGNHPSFCMMSLGNELWGSKRVLGQILNAYKQADPSRLYTQGSNNFQFVPDILPQEDFYVGVRLAQTDEQRKNDRLLRGSCACCDAPFGHIQNEKPAAKKRYDRAICPQDGRIEPKLPVISHEIGQYEMYPNFEQMEKYTGVLRPDNLKIFQQRLAQKGMAAQANQFFACSGKLAVQCYQQELEAAFRSEKLAGFQILDLQDFTGQGTALVGILDAFMESKGLIDAKEWRGFCSDSVLLAEFDSFCVTGGMEFTWQMKLSDYRFIEPLPTCRLLWSIQIEAENDGLHTEEYGKQKDEHRILTEGEEAILAGSYGFIDVATKTLTLPMVEKTTKMSLYMELPYRGISKKYELWMYPHPEQNSRESMEKLLTNGKNPEKEKMVITQSYQEARANAEQGKQVLYLAYEELMQLKKGGIEETQEQEIKQQIATDSIPGMYCTNFWNFPMFRSICEDKGVEIPTGTLGLYIQKEHEALGAFPSEAWTTPQWYAVIENSVCAVLEDIQSSGVMPIVQVIDNVERNHKLGILYEIPCKTGNILVCTTDLLTHQDNMVIRQYTKSLCQYVKNMDC